MERVGVLALQGGYQRHIDCLDRLGVASQPVRLAADLDACTALILPGGESTSITRLIEVRTLLPALRVFSQTHPVLGTCAGLILMAHCDDPRVVSLELLDVQMTRNAYGRQTHSFQTELQLTLDGTAVAFPGIFIRAPQILACGAEVEVLGQLDGRPVLVAQGWHMGLCFHPELSDDPRLHAEWLRRAHGSEQPAARQRVSA